MRRRCIHTVSDARARERRRMNPANPCLCCAKVNPIHGALFRSTVIYRRAGMDDANMVVGFGDSVSEKLVALRFRLIFRSLR